jgi:alkanesulfonate monooxygenase SsuD/methylene tetrahydromethanopterin reductase-like flavin-dependent oxidoreductase (luciferase family)
MDYRVKPWVFEAGRATIWTKADLDVDERFVGVAGSPTTVSGLAQAPSRERRREMLCGTPDEMARRLAELLRAALQELREA